LQGKQSFKNVSFNSNNHEKFIINESLFIAKKEILALNENICDE
tara:strand:- start:397 stop:528 length:132 start_codon:yes stop_codon:yes gene_type:complete